MNTEDLIKNVLDDVASFSIKDIPDIDLYMDQVTTYLNNKFSGSKRHEDDKLLTKTMINNYAKSRLLPPPEKKKYSKDHIIVLAMIYFFKNVISINDVTTILKPLLDNHFHNDENSLEDIVNSFLDRARNSDIPKLIIDEFQRSVKNTIDTIIDDKEYSQTLELISIFSYDMFVRKMIVEKLIDSLPETRSEKNTAKDDPDKENAEGKTKKETD